jgi:predicted RNase H-like nuclease (RuvC/YqgF family)
MDKGMVSANRTDKGQFNRKGEELRKLRNIRLTDTCWDTLHERAKAQDKSRPDLIEEFALAPDNSDEVEALRREVKMLKLEKDALAETLEEVEKSLESAHQTIEQLQKQVQEQQEEMSRLGCGEATQALTIATDGKGASTPSDPDHNSSEKLEKMRSLLEDALQQKANTGGEIKKRVRLALALIESQS